MKNAIIKLLFFSMVIVGGITVANAQVSSDTVFRAKIPFKFIVRDKSFPAGDYLIKPTDDMSDSVTMFDLTSLDNGKTQAIIFDTEPTTANSRPAQSDLVFDKVNGRYYLTELWAAGETDGNKVELTKTEREAVDAGKVKHERKLVRSGRMKVVERGE